MEKKYFFRTMFVAIIAATFTFGAASCSDDDDVKPGSEKPTPPEDEDEISKMKLTSKITNTELQVDVLNGIVKSSTETVVESSYTYSADSLVTDWVNHTTINIVKSEGPIPEKPSQKTKSYTLTYNDSKQLVSKRETIKEEGGFINPNSPTPAKNYITVYTYGDKEIVATTTQESSAKVSAATVVIYKTDGAGRVVESIGEDIYNSRYKYVYEYDANGNMIKSIRTDLKNDYLSTVTNEYDSKNSFDRGIATTLFAGIASANNLLKSITVLDPGSQYIETSTYKYDADDYPISREMSTVLDNTGLPGLERSLTMTSTYEYCK